MTTTPTMDPSNAAPDLDKSVDDLILEASAGAGDPAPPSASGRPAAEAPPRRVPAANEPPTPVATQPPVMKPATPPAPPASTTQPATSQGGASETAAPESSFTDVDALLGGVQADLDSPPPPPPTGTRPPAAAAPPPAAARPVAKNIEDLDNLLAGEAAAALSTDAADAPPLARAVAANPPGDPLPSSPSPAQAGPAPVQPGAAAAPSAAPAPSAAGATNAETTPAAPASAPARRPGPIRRRLAALAGRVDRLSPQTRQTVAWAAYVTLVSAAALWAVVLTRSPRIPAKPEAAADGHGAPAAPDGQRGEIPRAAPAPAPGH
jgi:hypothetical protein